MSPDTQKGLLADIDWRNRGDEYADYQPLVAQLSNYLKDTKLSTVPDIYILEIEDFIDHLQKKAEKKRWKLVAKRVLNATYAIAASLAYMINHQPDKRSSTKFFTTLLHLREIMRILKIVYRLNDDYKLPEHLQSS
jgi:hypothetical protein